MADKEKSDVKPSANMDGVAPSVTVASGDSSSSQEENSVKVGHDNLYDVNVGETPSNFTADLNKGTPDKSSYANVISTPSRSKVNFHTLFTPTGNEIDVVVPVESSYARAMIELRADVELKDNIVVAMPKVTGEGYYTCNIHVVYEWGPPRCTCCKVFGHSHEECPKNIGSGEMTNSKKPSQTSRGVSVGQKVGFKPIKQVFLPVSKKPTASTSEIKKKNLEPTKE
ncbi:hypothetical protein Tco_1366015, partial [Tanacetum coccineum]